MRGVICRVFVVQFYENNGLFLRLEFTSASEFLCFSMFLNGGELVPFLYDDGLIFP